MLIFFFEKSYFTKNMRTSFNPSDTLAGEDAPNNTLMQAVFMKSSKTLLEPSVYKSSLKE